MFEEAYHHVRLFIGKARHLPELLNPYVFKNALHPLGLNQLLFPLPGINTVLGNQHPAAVEVLAYAPQHTCVAGADAVVHIRPGKPHLQRKEHGQVDGAHHPQEIGENELAVVALVIFRDNLQKVRTHQDVIDRGYLFLEQPENHFPLHFPV